MPLVRATFQNSQLSTLGYEIGEALWELVPSAFNSVQGQLTPGSIVYISQVAGDGSQLTVDVFVEIEAYFYEDRAKNLDERCEKVGLTLEGFFPGFTFAVWGKLVTAGWCREAEDPSFDGDMSLPAAMERLREKGIGVG